MRDFLPILDRPVFLLKQRSVEVPGFRFARFWWQTAFAKMALQPTILVRFAGGDDRELQERASFSKKSLGAKIVLLEEAPFLPFVSPFLFAHVQS